MNTLQTLCQHINKETQSFYSTCRDTQFIVIQYKEIDPHYYEQYKIQINIYIKQN